MSGTTSCLPYEHAAHIRRSLPSGALPTLWRLCILLRKPSRHSRPSPTLITGPDSPLRPRLLPLRLLGRLVRATVERRLRWLHIEYDGFIHQRQCDLHRGNRRNRQHSCLGDQRYGRLFGKCGDGWTQA